MKQIIGKTRMVGTICIDQPRTGFLSPSGILNKPDWFDLEAHIPQHALQPPGNKSKPWPV